MNCINYLIQIFFVRLTRCQRGVIHEAEITSVCISGSVSLKVEKQSFLYWFSLQYFIVPFTGWRGAKYRYVGKQRSFRITRELNVKTDNNNDRGSSVVKYN